ncbi:MAG: rod shape-determining protein MreD [Clostridia bacterium]|nr:rod shape-determining protein MreD [Clostridia bacterium]
MTRQDFITKWALYAVGLLPVWWLEVFVLNRFPLFGIIPMLLPLAAVAVAVLEGPLGGAGFGLAVGVLCDAVYFGTNGTMTLALTLIGWAAGAAATYVLDRTFWGCLLCSVAALFTIGTARVFVHWFTAAAALPVLLRVAAPEFLWSLAFVTLVYPWFRFLNGRIKHMLRM